MFANILSLFQCYNYFIIYKLKIAWLKSKQAIHHDETFITTGYYKWYMLQLFFVFFQPYWFFLDITFTDPWNEYSKDLKFQFNDYILVC